MEALAALSKAVDRSIEGPAVKEVVTGVLRESVVPDEF